MHAARGVCVCVCVCFSLEDHLWNFNSSPITIVHLYPTEPVETDSPAWQVLLASWKTKPSLSKDIRQFRKISRLEGAVASPSMYSPSKGARTSREALRSGYFNLAAFKKEHSISSNLTDQLYTWVSDNQNEKAYLKPIKCGERPGITWPGEYSNIT